MADTVGTLSDKAITTRVRLARAHMENHGRIDKAASAAFRDGSLYNNFPLSVSDEWEVSQSPSSMFVPKAKVNMIAVNLLVKIAAVAINTPDVHVDVGFIDDPELTEGEVTEVSKKWWRSQWLQKNWRRVSNTALLKASMCGLGFVRYYWDVNGPEFEHVHSWNVGIDPNATDWQNLKFACVRIRMSLRTALQRYPHAKVIRGRVRDLTDRDSLDSADSAVDVVVYHDTDTAVVDSDTGTTSYGIEAHCIEDEVVFRGPNLYGRVPLLVYEGNIDPNATIFPIGDYQLAAGLQAGYDDISSIIFNKARNNGPVTVFSPSRFDRAAQEALKEGQYGQWLAAKSTSVSTDPPIVRIPGEEITQAEIEAKREIEQALDAAMSITQYQRGVINQNVRFATEAAIMANQSGARPVASRIDYENFMTRWAAVCFQMLKDFGGPRTEADGQPAPITEEEIILWQTLQHVISVRIVEGSTAYKDPAIDQQQSMQLFEMAARNLPMLLQFAQVGIVDKLPNMSKLFEDVLRAFGRYEMGTYFIDANGGMQPPPGVQQMSPAPGGAAETGPEGPAASVPLGPNISVGLNEGEG